MKSSWKQVTIVFCSSGVISLAVISAFVFCFQASPCYASSDDLLFVTSEYPPYSYSTRGRQVGLAAEMANAVMQRLGVTQPLLVVPFARAGHMAAFEPDTVVFPIMITSENEKNYHLIHKVANRQVGLFKHKRNKAVVVDPLCGSLSDNIVGFKRGASAEEMIKEMGGVSLHAASSDIINILMLAEKRVDLIAIEKLVLAHALDEYNRRTFKGSVLRLEDFIKVCTLPVPECEKGLYFVMSKDSRPEIVAAVRNAFAAVEKGGILEVAHWWTNDVEKPMLDVYRHALAAEGITWIDYTFVGGAGHKMRDVLEMREKAEHLPHAMQTYMGPALWDWASKGVLVDLSQMAEAKGWKNVLPPLVEKMIQYDDRYVAVPLNMQRVNWMWFNPSVFRQAGVEPPATWKELFVAAQRIKAAGYIPISLGDEAWQEAVLFENIALGIGGEEFYRRAFLELDFKTLGGPTMVQVLTYFRKIKQYTSSTAMDQTWTASAERVAEGEAAMLFMGDWVKNVFKDADLQFGDHGYLCMPSPGTKGVFLNNTDVFTFPQGSRAAIPHQITMASVLMDKAVQRDFNMKKGSIPARIDIDSEGFDEVTRMSMRSLRSDVVLPSFVFRQAAPEDVHRAVIDFISRFFNSNQQPEQAAKELARLVQEISP